MSGAVPRNVRAIVFDAVGTLIHPHPPAATLYADAARRFGSNRTEAEIASRFAAAFRRQEEADRANSFRTDEVRELARWRSIVAEVLDDVSDPERCFQYLYRHFGRPSAWAVEADALATIAALMRQGYRTGIASNFDHRLRDVLAPGELSELTIVISSEVGWRKPARQFFDAVCTALRITSAEVLHVGDDRANDFDGATAAGMSAILFDPRKRYPKTTHRVEKLSELPGD